ncbi:hypothetical protein [Pelosinus sp. IPA-1]|uniref:hypothetical protein n=1 Tax=Pelosinus sp. IPA-1 TaxID=3029569 RepID=UPI0024362AD1|nr:hypothetical protein [Pelosinus sp. IPA-1]GMB00922.1 hypothetical protein PIPA1_37210 [Pelosinus sp. IPA-1]
MIDTIIDKTSELLKKEPSLANVVNWHKINGLVPGQKRTVSVGCDDEDYNEYTRSLDEGIVKLKIYASLDNRELSANSRRTEEHRLEYGERCIRQFANNIRLCLVSNHSLDGVADTSFVPKIEYVTADEHRDLHIAVISFEVKFYATRESPYREMTMPIVMTGPGSLTSLPISPVVSIVDIPGYVQGVDYITEENGIQWKSGKGPAAGTAIPVTWRFSADNENVKVGKIIFDINGENVEIS